MLKERNVGLDVVRFCAVLSVLSVHFFLNTFFYSTPTSGKIMYLEVFLRMGFMICVPLFLLLTGYLQSSKRPTLQYFKKLIPILVIYLLYSILAILFRIYINHEIKTVSQWFVSIFNFSADPYSWYMKIFIELYIACPFMNIFYNFLKRKHYKEILILVVLFLISAPTLFEGHLNGPLSYVNYLSTFYPVFYYLVGCYIKEYQPRINKAVGVLLFLFFITIGTMIETKGLGVFESRTGYYGGLLILCEAVIFFVTFYQSNIKNQILIRFITLVSILSLDIYLASYMSDRLVYTFVLKHFFVSQQKVLFFFVPIIVSTFIISFVISYLRHKLLPIRELRSRKIADTSMDASRPPL